MVAARPRGAIMSACPCSGASSPSTPRCSSAAVAVLALSPATVSSRINAGEVAVLGLGVAAVLAVNLLALRRVFGPLERLTALMRRVDPLAPGQRIEIERQAAEVAELSHAFNDMLDRLERERRDSARRALDAQEEERRRMARELHDEIGQTLTGVVLQLETLEAPRARGAARRAALARGVRARRHRGGARARAPAAAGGARRLRAALGARLARLRARRAQRPARLAAARRRPPDAQPRGRARGLPRRPGEPRQRRAPRARHPRRAQPAGRERRGRAARARRRQGHRRDRAALRQRRPRDARARAARRRRPRGRPRRRRTAPRCSCGCR